MKSKTYNVVVLASVCAVATLVFSAVAGYFQPAITSVSAQEDSTNRLPRTITVIGEGRVNVEPDMAQINIGVEVMAPTVQEAASQTSQTMEQLTNALLQQGIAENDIQTSNYNVYAERPFNMMEGPGSSGMSEINYRFSNNVTVIVRDLSKIEDILGAGIEAGANNIYGVSFGIDDPSSLRAEAREEAVQVAKAKAEELATLNGVTVGQVVTISEVVNSAMPFANSANLQMSEGFGGGGPISPGELEVRVQLQLTYEIE
ncbi:SIMPL domain-containing protein [Anaerolineales bacterium HSG25]|nr:SIMPL domain-containing protein [Anaerolineales bacterium HSG25]